MLRACHYDRLHIIRYLIENVGVNPNPVNQNDWSVVGEVSLRGKLTTLKYLCEEVNVNVLAMDCVSEYPIKICLRASYHLISALLIKQSRCPVIMATAYGELEILKYLTTSYYELIQHQLCEVRLFSCILVIFCTINNTYNRRC